MHQTTRRLPGRWLAAALALTLAATLAACGGAEEPTVADPASQSEAAGNPMDRAFVAEMIPHHESAVDMAEIALERGEGEFVKRIAKDIVRTQNEEITTMRRIDRELAEQGVERGRMNMPSHEMGMEMDDGAMAELREADPFDRAFIDEMIPHHQGAIRMARLELEQGRSAELEQLAEAIIDAQAREIREMNAEREKRFGAPSPAGGVPAEAEQGAGAEHDGMDTGP